MIAILLTDVLRRIWCDSRGASALEFAILVPVFLFLVLGLVQCSLAFFTYHVMENALSAGARYLYFNSTDESGAETVIRQSAVSSFLDTRLMTVESEPVQTPYPHMKFTMTYVFAGIGLGIPGSGLHLSSSVAVPLADN